MWLLGNFKLHGTFIVFLLDTTALETERKHMSNIEHLFPHTCEMQSFTRIGLWSTWESFSTIWVMTSEQEVLVHLGGIFHLEHTKLTILIQCSAQQNKEGQAKQKQVSADV